MQPETVAVFHADKFEPWKLLGDYKLIDQLIKQYPEGFDITVSRYGVYHFRPSFVPQDPEISSWGIYVGGGDVYRITSSLYGKKRKPRKKKDASSALVNEAETTKTNSSTSTGV